ncbi:MAG: STAS-like domain-containing protein [bacterium]
MNEIQDTNSIVLKELFPNFDFLGSREAGSIVREQIKDNIDKKNKVILDFKGISLITQSFGDEIMGIFIRAFGDDFFKNNVEIINANGKVNAVLSIVNQYSKSQETKMVMA